MMAHRYACRVYYEDTDAAGIVYYANYLKFVERARTEALEELGIDQRRLRESHGIVFAVKSVAVDYLLPARLRDQLVVTTALTGVGAARADLAQDVWRAEDCLARCRVTVVALGAQGRPLRFSADVRAALARLTVAAPGH